MTTATPHADHAAPAPEDTPAELTLRVWDGAELFYRAWVRDPASPRAVFLFHRGHEHSGRLLHLAEAINLPGVNIFAWDARGHGRSPGRRGFAPDFSAMVRDMESFVRGVCERHRVRAEESVVVGMSVGGVVAATWVHDYAPPIRAMALVAPAFRVKLYVPLAIPALRMLRLVRPAAAISSYVKPKMLTRDKAMARSYADDPLISRDISNNILLDMHDTATRVLGDAPAIHTPTLVQIAGTDWVVKRSPQETFVRDVGSTIARCSLHPGFKHAIPHDLGRERPIGEIRAFIAEAFDAPPPDMKFLAEHGDATSRAKHEILSRPLPALSLKRLMFGATRMGLRVGGLLSRGIGIGWRTGFDSGESLDHVYRNTAQGFTPLGKWIDRIYLDSVGWRGIRQRKIHLQSRLLACIRSVHESGMPVRVLDIAAGPGRYVLETMAAAGDIPVTAFLRDRSVSALEAGRNLAADMGLGSRVSYETGDAFDANSIASASPSPTIAIVSGLYELFPDNALLSRSLDGLSRALPRGGYLIYTNQPWHPQLEFIARVLINRDNQRWVMRCRPQMEIDTLVARAGFRKFGMDIDRWGIFTVSVARKL